MCISSIRVPFPRLGCPSGARLCRDQALGALGRQGLLCLLGFGGYLGDDFRRFGGLNNDIGCASDVFLYRE